MIERYSRPEMVNIWSEDHKFKLWLEVETLALEAFVKLGLAPQTALENVRKKANFSPAKILEIEKEVKHDVIAFLTNVGEYVGEDARYLHLGMTSSDLLDTAFSVQLIEATDLILKNVEVLLDVLKVQAEKYKNTPCIGRSHGIHAEPITFGLKLASFYAEIKRHQKRIVEARNDMAVGAISGPVGTFAHLSPEVEEHVCRSLGLTPDPISTQIIQRDRHSWLFLSFAELASGLERIAVEVRHLQRTEVREVEEFFSQGQKGSSAMPHKRNPILSENVSGLARLIRAWSSASLENLALWHERDISHSSVERVIAPDITITLDFALHRVIGLMKNIVVYPNNMLGNLNLTGGLIFSGKLLVELTSRGLKREDAYALVQTHALAAWEEINNPILGVNSSGGSPKKSFIERIKEDKQVKSMVSPEELEKICSLEPHLKHVDYIYNRVFK